MFRVVRVCTCVQTIIVNAVIELSASLLGETGGFEETLDLTFQGSVESQSKEWRREKETS